MECHSMEIKEECKFDCPHVVTEETKQENEKVSDYDCSQGKFGHSECVKSEQIKSEQNNYLSKTEQTEFIKDEDVVETYDEIKTELDHRENTKDNELHYDCNFDYNAPDQSVLATRNKSHTSEKTWSCTICSYSCPVKSRLVKHIKIHSGERPYVCSLCNYAA